MLKVARVSSVIAVSAALVGSLALPATAAEPVPVTDSTKLTVTVPGGKLQISAPEEAAFEAFLAGVSATTTATVKDITVSDTRGQLLSSWTTTVSLSEFSGDTPTNTFKIPAENATYLPGPATFNNGVALVIPGGAAFNLQSPQTAQTAVNIAGNHTATWSPLLTLNVPNTATPDTYTATLLHSVL